MTITARRSVAVRRTTTGWAIAGPVFVFAAVTFNAVLAVINSHVAHLSPQIVILAEVCVLGGAHLFSLFRYRPEMATWYLLLGLMLVVFLIRWLITGEVEPKYVRDVGIIPTFIILGLASDPKELDRTVLLILAVVTAVGLVEAFLPDLYSSTFNVQDYYILTRGNVADDFYTKDSTLYVSAIRGDERFFSFLDIPRMSSIFLEPVSLGNYCTIMVAYFCARFWRLSALTLFAGGLAIAFLLVGSDGRLAAASAILIIAVCLLAPSLPRFSAAIYLPLAIMAAGGVVFVMNPSPYTDDFPGRLAYTMDLLGQLRLSDWLGVSGTSGEEAMDSGIAYLILTQSLIGTALIWLFLTCLSEQKTREQIRYIHALLLYLALTMTVSYSMLTIKTAALAWFIHGILQQPGRKKRVAHLPGK